MPPDAPAVALAILLLLATAVALVYAGRPAQLVVLIVGAAVAGYAGWPASGHAALAAGAAYLIIETASGRLDAEHVGAQLVLTVLVAGSVFAAGRELPRVRSRAAEQAPRRREVRAWDEPATVEAVHGGRPDPGTLEYEVERARRHERPLSFLVLRPDELEFLAAAGAGGLARLLDLVTEALEDTVRAIDVVERSGEHRFEVVLPETAAVAARTVAERIRLRIDAARPEVDGRPIGLSVSIGVASYPDDAANATELAGRAEQALRRASELGGNRTVLYSLPAGAPRGWSLRG